MEFKAVFYCEHVWIDGRAYRCNEMLTACLNLSEPELNGCLVSLWRLVPAVRLREVSSQSLRACLGNMQRAQELFSRVGTLTGSLPFLRRGGSVDLSLPRLPALLDRLCLDSGAGPSAVEDSFSFVDFYFMRIASSLSALTGPEAARELDLLSRGVCELLEQYIYLTADLLQARRAYSLLLDGYIHKKRSFLTADQLADCFSRYFHDSAPLGEYEKLPSSCFAQSRCEPFISDGGACLSTTCVFSRLRDFLYADFFRGLEYSHLPRRCDNCGRYFLLAGGKYSSYCENPLPGEPEKTCRSIGAKQRYGNKCRNDPVWLIYNRAYKAHYARFMKGKMTSSDFERWSRYAVSLRNQASDGTLGAEQYERLIKE